MASNMEALLGQFPDRLTVVIYQDTPLFISENCALAAMSGRCPAGAGCRESEREWQSGSGETIRLIQQGCRTVAVNAVPFCLSGRLDELRNAGARNFRADFILRHYDPESVCGRWRDLRHGRPVPGHEGNYKRGLR